MPRKQLAGDAPPAKLGGALAPKGLPPAMISCTACGPKAREMNFLRHSHGLVVAVALSWPAEAPRLHDSMPESAKVPTNSAH